MNEHGAVGVTRQIAEFVVNASFAELPPEAITAAKRCVLDGTAVILAGSTEPCARIVRTYVRDVGGREEATTLGAGAVGAPVHLAALANGVAGHALDWDDTALSRAKDRSVLIHPTMQPLCASYALAEHLSASGRAFLTAFILGFEVQVKIAEAIHPDHFTDGRGFHSSGTIGVFGAAAAAARLMRLSQAETLNALAIAATLSAGLGVHHGTMSKPLNMGRAAETGVTAARLAGLGFDGASNALEGGRGFFGAFGGGYASDRITGRLGNPFAILDPGVSVKPYPSGVVGHPGMDAMNALVNRHDIDPADVEKVHVRTGSNVIFPGPLRIVHADTALEARFCVPFQMAAIILRRKAGRAEFSDEFVRSGPCRELQRKVVAEVDPDLDASGKDKVVFAIELTTKNGRTYSQQSEEHYRGGPDNPLTWDELTGKFRDCAAGCLDEATQARFIMLLRGLDGMANVSDLVPLLTAGPGPPE